MLAAKSVAYSSGPSGFYLADLFKKMGIADQIKDKVKQTPSGVHYLGPLPADIQHTTVFSAGLHMAAPAPNAAKALTKFLTAPEAATVIRRSGMEPG